jgi:integrase
MVASGANVKTVQAQLGHKTATMTLDRTATYFPTTLTT